MKFYIIVWNITMQWKMDINNEFKDLLNLLINRRKKKILKLILRKIVSNKIYEDIEYICRQCHENYMGINSQN